MKKSFFPFVFWALAPEMMRFVRPHLLLTAAPAAEVEIWRLRNRWADRVPMLRAVKGDEAGKPGAQRVVDGHGGLDLCAWLPEGGYDADGWDRRSEADALLHDGPQVVDFTPEEEAGANPLDLFVWTAGILAHRRQLPTWEILGQHTDGALAIGAAAGSPARRALCQALAVPGPLAAAVSRANNVSIRVVLDAQELRDAIDEQDRALRMGV